MDRSLALVREGPLFLSPIASITRRESSFSTPPLQCDEVFFHFPTAYLFLFRPPQGLTRPMESFFVTSLFEFELANVCEIADHFLTLFCGLLRSHPSCGRLVGAPFAIFPPAAPLTPRLEHSFTLSASLIFLWMFKRDSLPPNLRLFTCEIFPHSRRDSMDFFCSRRLFPFLPHSGVEKLFLRKPRRVTHTPFPSNFPPSDVFFLEVVCSQLL